MSNNQNAFIYGWETEDRIILINSGKFSDNIISKWREVCFIGVMGLQFIVQMEAKSLIELVKDFIIALGGGSVVLIGMLTIFKGLFVKFFESGIESSFEKNIERFKNELQRSTRAYEILLDREMRFYEKIEPIVAELIPLVQDLCNYSKYDEVAEREKRCEAFRKCLKRYMKLIILLKNESLIHQSYIPQEVFSAFAEVVKQMQEDSNYWLDIAKLLFAGEYDKITMTKLERQLTFC